MKVQLIVHHGGWAFIPLETWPVLSNLTQNEARVIPEEFFKAVEKDPRPLRDGSYVTVVIDNHRVTRFFGNKKRNVKFFELVDNLKTFYKRRGIDEERRRRQILK